MADRTERFYVRDPAGRIRTVKATTTRGAMAVFVSTAKTPPVPGDYEIRAMDDLLGTWDVYTVKGTRR